MQLLKTSAALGCFLAMARSSTPAATPTATPAVSVGLVPTMGALHAGHLSLIARARAENDRVVVTVFVNPLQFAPGEDFERYPRDLAADLALAAAAGVDAVFAPTAEGLGLTHAMTQVVPPPTLTETLGGATRPGHFSGVATIVVKLLSLVRPDRVYFGQKDAQQVAIVRRLVADLSLPGQVVVCPTVREASGLALSSRNAYLSEAQRQEALALHQALQAATDLFRAGERSAPALRLAAEAQLTAAGIDQEYLALVDPTDLQPLGHITDQGLLALAARVGSTRLIDNVLLEDCRPIVAIDGPAGAGKSTVTRRVAAELGLLFLDTGAMYRAVTWRAIAQGIDPSDRLALAELVAACHIRLGVPAAGGEQRVWINDGQGEVEATIAIRTAEVTANVSKVAAHPEVRQALVAWQREFGQRGGLVAEGRDIGTQVFPQAEVKIFLTATPAERARRRSRDLADRGLAVPDLATLEAEIVERDRQDSTRAVAPLIQAADAWELVSDGLTIEAVVAAIVARYRAIVGAIVTR